MSSGPTALRFEGKSWKRNKVFHRHRFPRHGFERDNPRYPKPRFAYGVISVCGKLNGADEKQSGSRNSSSTSNFTTFCSNGFYLYRDGDLLIHLKLPKSRISVEVFGPSRGRGS